MLGFRVHGDVQSVYSGRASPSRGTAERNLLGRGLGTSGLAEDGSPGFLAILTSLWTRTRGLLLDNLGFLVGSLLRSWLPWSCRRLQYK